MIKKFKKIHFFLEISGKKWGNVVNYKRKVKKLLKTNMEFRKGILFIRLKGDLNKDTIKGIIDKDFKYVVLNIDDMYSIDSYSIKYLNKIYKLYENNNNKFIICDKFNVSRKLLRDIPKINREYDAFELFERMI